MDRILERCKAIPDLRHESEVITQKIYKYLKKKWRGGFDILSIKYPIRVEYWHNYKEVFTKSGIFCYGQAFKNKIQIRIVTDHKLNDYSPSVLFNEIQRIVIHELRHIYQCRLINGFYNIVQKHGAKQDTAYNIKKYLLSPLEIDAYVVELKFMESITGKAFEAVAKKMIKSMAFGCRENKIKVPFKIFKQVLRDWTAHEVRLRSSYS